MSSWHYEFVGCLAYHCVINAHISSLYSERCEENLSMLYILIPLYLTLICSKRNKKIWRGFIDLNSRFQYRHQCYTSLYSFRHWPPLLQGLFHWFLVFIVLLVQVNASAQFCGVAEMVGPVDFDNSVDYWQQDKWTGQFPVKWHIIKDVPNSQFRHIIIKDNDNKPVTNSRDTQEVRVHLESWTCCCISM